MRVVTLFTIGSLGAACSTVAPIRGVENLGTLEARATGVAIPVSLEVEANIDVMSRGCSFIMVRSEDDRTYEVQFPACSEIIFARLSPGRYELSRLVCSEHQWVFLHRNNPTFEVFPYRISVVKGILLTHTDTHHLDLRAVDRERSSADISRLFKALPPGEEVVSGHTGKTL